MADEKKKEKDNVVKMEKPAPHIISPKGIPADNKFGQIGGKGPQKPPEPTDQEKACFKILEEAKNQVKPGVNIGVFFVNEEGHLYYQMSDATYYFKKRVMDELEIMCDRDKFQMYYREQTEKEMGVVMQNMKAKQAAQEVQDKLKS